MNSSDNPRRLERAAPLTESERVAAEWVLRQAQGLSADQERDLARWQAEDPRHGGLLAEMEETSRLLDGMKFQSPAAPVATSEAQPAVSRRRFLRGIGIAAAVALGFVTWQFAGRSPADFTLSASTGLGEFRRLDLPDGSQVILNTDTSVEIAYDDRVRQVRLLGGQAFFEVAKNPARPFIVQAGKVAVRAVGTAFEVRLRAATLDVLVTEGRVRVSGEVPSDPSVPSGGVDLGPELVVGHRAQLALDADRASRSAAMVVSTVEPRALRAATAWQEGRLAFFDQPLADVVAEFNRYNRRKIVIADEGLAARRFGGGFASHQVEPFIELLEQSFGVVVEQRGEETVLRRGR